MLAAWLPAWVRAADPAAPDLTGLSQYGAVGVILLAFLVWAWRAWLRLEARCDRLETQLAEQSKFMAERLVVVLTQATSEIARIAEERRRR